MNKEEHNEILKYILTTIEDRPESYSGKRILVSGSSMDKPDFITSDNTMYTLYWDALEGKRRYATTDRNGGATELEFNGMPVVADGGQSGNCPARTMYFLNLDYLYLRPSSNRNLVSIGKRVSLNQDAYVDGFMWAGNMTTSNASLQGVIVNNT